MSLQLTQQRAQEIYGEHKGKSFFETLVNFMTSGPVYALVLAKQNAIKEWRSLMGPTNSNTARAEKPKRSVSPGTSVSFVALLKQLVKQICSFTSNHQDVLLCMLTA